MGKILVVDDDPQFIDIISFQIKKSGHTVDVAHTQDQALELLKHKNYDVVLQDVFFPNRYGGLSLLSRYRQEKLVADKTPILLVTSMPTQLFMEEPNIDKYMALAKEIVSKTDNYTDIADKINALTQGKA